jgi:hypothetical protein
MFKRFVISMAVVLALASSAQATHPHAFRLRVVAPRHHVRAAFIAPVYHAPVAFVAPVAAPYCAPAQFAAPVQGYNAQLNGCGAFFQFRSY